MICWKLIISHSFRSNTMASGFIVQVYYVEGLHMGKGRFDWNDKLIFTDALLRREIEKSGTIGDWLRKDIESIRNSSIFGYVFK